MSKDSVDLTAVDKDLDKGDILFEGEAPQHIIGYRSIVGRSGFEPCWSRIRDGGSQWTMEDVRGHIKSMITTLRSCRNYGHQLQEAELTALVSAEDPAKTARQLLLEKVLGPSFRSEYADKSNQHGPRIEIDRPTLLIYVPTYDFMKFTAPYISPTYGGKDPHTSGCRLWENRTVMGWYSRYDHGKTGSKPGDHYYDTVTTTIPGAIVPAVMFTDPGNGNGGDSSIP